MKGTKFRGNPGSSPGRRLANKFGLACATGIQVGDTVITLFPSFHTSKTINVHTKTLIEWSHAERKEAPIVGAGRGTFYLDFFATDYSENRKRYASSSVVNVALAGLAYVVDSHVHDGDSYPSFVSGLCAYLPSPERSGISEFDFIGNALSVGNIKIHDAPLLIVDVQLVNDDENSGLFNLPMIMNPKNMRIREISVGDMITGCFWLQGRILGCK